MILGSVSAIYSSIVKYCSVACSHIFKTFSIPDIFQGMFIMTIKYFQSQTLALFQNMLAIDDKIKVHCLTSLGGIGHITYFHVYFP